MRLSKRITLTALMTALTFVSTVLIRFPMGGANPNLGDAAIFITAYLLGPWSALIAGAIGSCLADLLVYPISFLYTLIIKGLEGLVVGLLMKYLVKHKPSNFKDYLRLILCMFIGTIVMMGGYYVCKAFIYGTPAAALLSLLTNGIQGVLSITVGTIVISLLPMKLLSKNY